MGNVERSSVQRRRGGWEDGWLLGGSLSSRYPGRSFVILCNLFSESVLMDVVYQLVSVVALTQCASPSLTAPWAPT